MSSESVLMRYNQYLSVVAALFLVAATTAGATHDRDATSPERRLVGFEPGGLEALATMVEEAGGEIVRASDEAGLAIVLLPASAATDLARDAAVRFVALESSVTSAGGEWAGGEWAGGEWAGGEWAGGEWAGGEWAGGEWAGGEWAGGEWAGDGEYDPGYREQWGLQRIRAVAAWQEGSGDRQAILCTVDSGVDADHPDLARNLWRDPETGAVGWNAIDGSTDVTDGGGHGTHVAGVAAGVIGNGYGVAGVADVRVMAVKALTDEGTGSEGDIALGIVWCVDHGADVVLLALVTDHLGDGLEQALDYAASNDVVIVAAAGNGGPCADCVGLPASSPHAIAVSATDARDKLASFSTKGAEVELAAPGESILGTFPDDRFMFGSGTSQAAAFVAGAAALLRDTNPSLTAEEVRTILAESAHDLGKPGRDAQFGHGLLDLRAAVATATGGT